MVRSTVRVRSTGRLRVTDWISKMLFLWSREPLPVAVSTSPKPGPWFACFATAVFIWRYRKQIARVVFGATGSQRLLKRKRGLSTSIIVSKAHHHQSKVFKQPSVLSQQQLQSQTRHLHHRRRRDTLSSTPDSSDEHRRSRHIKHHQNSRGNSSSNSSSSSSPSEQQKPQAQRREVNRRLHAGDGPHMNVDHKLGISASCYQISQQLYCRMTRSGRVYGRYPTKSSVK